MKKQDFQAYRLLLNEIRRIEEDLLALEASIYAPSGQKFDSIPGGSGVPSTVADLAASHDSLIEYYQEKLTEKNQRLLEIEMAIDSLADPAERLVMQLRYIKGQSWRTVCLTMAGRGFSERTVYRLHGEALLKLQQEEKENV